MYHTYVHIIGGVAHWIIARAKLTADEGRAERSEIWKISLQSTRLPSTSQKQ